jgi:hypothetical protein
MKLALRQARALACHVGRGSTVFGLFQQRRTR